MVEKIIKSISLIIAFAIVCGILAVICIFGEKAENSIWNNGYHSCGGKWVYQQAVGHSHSTTYIYKCDKCGKTYEFNESR